MSAKLNYFIFGVATLSGVALRTVMLLFTLDPKSGFVVNEYSVFAYLMAALLCLGAVTVFGSSLAVKNVKDSEISLNGYVLPVSLILFSAGIVYESLFSSLPSDKGIFGPVLYGIVTVAAAASLIYIAVCKFIKAKYPPLLTLVPVVFWLVRLIVVFTNFSSLALVSDYVIETVFMCLALLTFFFYAKIECNQPIKHVRFFFAVSLVCGYAATLCSLPRIILEIVVKSQAVHLNPVPFSTGIVVAFFAVALSAKLLFEKLKEE